MVAEQRDPPERPAIGVAGLDEVLHEGLIPGRAYLSRGRPTQVNPPSTCAKQLWRREPP
jgi:hypothetical protein